jgi:hypothetical protein
MAITKVNNDLLTLDAAQPTITSVGTLTNFTSTGIDDNATSNAITITSDENVGIGGAPSHPLHITKEIAGYQAYFNNDNGSGQGVKVRVKANDSGNFNMLELVSASSGSDVTAMVVRDDGNVAASGDVIVGSLARSAFTFVDSHPLLVGPNSNTNAGASFRNANGAEAFIQQNANNTAYMGTVTNHPLSIRTSNTDRLKIDASGRVTMPSQPAFSAALAGTQSNIPLGGSTTVAFATEIFDQGSNFAGSVFTAPVTGKYQLNTFVYFESVDSAAAYVQVSLRTSNRQYYAIFSTTSLDQDAAYMSMNVSVLADMDASDTAHVEIQLNNTGAAQMDINAISNFSGYLAC